jgi:hypothetical protein
MEAWQERVIQEKADLDVKIEKLQDWLDNTDHPEDEMISAMHDQLFAMCIYANALQRRIDLWGKEA